MYPTLLQIGDFTLPSYYTMITLGFLALVFVGWRESGRIGYDRDDFLDMALYMLLFGMIGARHAVPESAKVPASRIPVTPYAT